MQSQLSPDFHTATSNTGIARSTILGHPVGHCRSACGYPGLVTMQAAGHMVPAGAQRKEKEVQEASRRGRKAKKGRYLVAPEEVMRLCVLGSVTSR